MTQDLLGAKVNVAPSTIARLEKGSRRPSIDLLERLASALGCQVKDLIPEEEDRFVGEYRPILQGVPMNFRWAVRAARNGEEDKFGASIGSRPLLMFRYQYDYWYPGQTLARLLTLHDFFYKVEDFQKLEGLGYKYKNDPKTFYSSLFSFFKLEFPGCMALIPTDRSDIFMRGVLRVFGGYSHAFDLDFSAWGDLADWEKEVAADINRPGWRKKSQRYPQFVVAVENCLKWRDEEKWSVRGIVETESTANASVSEGGGESEIGTTR